MNELSKNRINRNSFQVKCEKTGQYDHFISRTQSFQLQRYNFKKDLSPNLQLYQVHSSKNLPSINFKGHLSGDLNSQHKKMNIEENKIDEKTNKTKNEAFLEKVHNKLLDKEFFKSHNSDFNPTFQKSVNFVKHTIKTEIHTSSSPYLDGRSLKLEELKSHQFETLSKATSSFSQRKPVIKEKTCENLPELNSNDLILQRKTSLKVPLNIHNLTKEIGKNPAKKMFQNEVPIEIDLHQAEKIGNFYRSELSGHSSSEERKKSLFYEHNPNSYNVIRDEPKKLKELKNFFMAALFSEPLKEHKTNKRDQNMSSYRIQHEEIYRPVHFSSEIRKIFSSIEKADHEKTVLKIAPLSINNFYQTLINSPEIIHIMCHGHKDGEEFTLDFENSRAIKVSVKSESVKKMLNIQKLTHTILVFINACHSGMLASSFIDAGAECVIYIHKDCPINDTIASHFAQLFYEKLFSGYSLEESFSISKKGIELSPECQEAIKLNYQFCNHSHTIDCLNHPLKKKSKKFENFVKSLKNCECLQKYHNRHSNECIKKLSIEIDGFGMNKYKLSNKNLWEICCCQKNVPHEERDKFEIIYKNNDSKTKQMEHLINKQSIWRDLQFYQFAWIRINFHEEHFYPKRFNDGIFKFYHYFIHNKGQIGLIYGKKGSGVRTFLQQFAYYCFHREKFDHVANENFENVRDFLEMNNRISKHLEIIKKTNKTGSSNCHIGSIRVLMICQEFDQVIESTNENIYEKLNEIHSQYMISYLISIRKKHQKTKLFQTRVMNIPELEPFDAMDLFLSYLKNREFAAKWDKSTFLGFKDVGKIFKELPKHPNTIELFARRIPHSEYSYEKWYKLALEIKEDFEKEN